MRISTDHSCSSAPETRRRTAASQRDAGFASTLASAVESGEEETSGRKPELSAATYRLFAAVATERGDTTHADLFRARAADAREAGLPLHPSGVLSDTGRWDYTTAAAAIPETGHFDTATGQGVQSFIPYDTTTDKTEKPADCDPTSEAAAAPSRLATEDVRSARSARAERDASVEALFATLAS